MSPAGGERKIEISASIMCIDWLNAGAQLDVLHAEGVDYLHVDIIDGRFSRDFTMGSSIIKRFRDHSELPAEFHLMVEEPSPLFDAFPTRAGDIFTIHQECCRNLHRDLVTLRRKGLRAGVAISPGTPIETLEYVIEDADVVLVLTVDPGYMGQRLVPQTLGKIEKLRTLIDRMGLDIRITVDGNVSFENVPRMVQAGADILVGGSSGLFRDDMPLEASIGKLREAIAAGLRA